MQPHKSMQHIMCIYKNARLIARAQSVKYSYIDACIQRTATRGEYISRGALKIHGLSYAVGSIMR